MSSHRAGWRKVNGAKVMSEHANIKTGLDKRPARIGGMFDDITPTYDRLNLIMSASIDRRWRKRTLEELDIQSGNRVLDIATGTGDMALQAVSMRRCEIVGLDLSKNMLKTALVKWREKFDDDPYPVLQGDALHMPFRDGTFDRAMVAFGIRNMVDIGQFLREVHRVLRPGGRLAVVEMSVPRLPVVREVFLFYLTKVMPLVVRMQKGDASSYRYLCDSIITFPAPKVLESMMEAQGLHVLRSIELTLGACHIYVLEKGSA
ncbi:MAG: ubiquinone/menaquinone biosynthesis methyltransferase [Methanomassiliicoccus sp.]|nr:ubiquinone/menaquinone biosynthesis methyltransferase [Methanomassiliicoccus sp.]